jgi:hypothetical protein
VPPKVPQETLAEMVDNRRSDVNYFMNKFKKLGFTNYNGGLRMNDLVLTVVLHDRQSATSAPDRSEVPLSVSDPTVCLPYEEIVEFLRLVLSCTLSRPVHTLCVLSSCHKLRRDPPHVTPCFWDWRGIFIPVDRSRSGIMCGKHQLHIPAVTN